MTHESLPELRIRAESLRRRNADEKLAFRRHIALQEQELRARHTAEEAAILRQLGQKPKEERLLRREREREVPHRGSAEVPEFLSSGRQEEQNRRLAWEITKQSLDIVAPVAVDRFDTSRKRLRRIGGPLSKPVWVVSVHDFVPDGMRSEMRLAFHRDGSWSLVGERVVGGGAVLVSPDAPLRMGLRQGFVYDTGGVRAIAEVVYSLHPIELRSLVLDSAR